MEIKKIDYDFSVCKVRDFSLIGILSKIACLMAENEIGIFALLERAIAEKQRYSDS